MIDFKTGNDWENILEGITNEPPVQQLFRKINVEYEDKKCYPPEDEIFNALKLTSYNDTRVVIIGQDPYINENQAHGLSFSVRPGYRVPPSLSNIFKELQDDVDCYIPNNGYLVPWTKQGVLLLNTVLTVRANMSGSHFNMGWEYFTDKVILKLNEKDKPICFMLWGSYAKKKLELIDQSKHYVLEAQHPSPLTRGAFFGCKHFSKCNKFLKERYGSEIDWQIPNIELS